MSQLACMDDLVSTVQWAAYYRDACTYLERSAASSSGCFNLQFGELSSHIIVPPHLSAGMEQENSFSSKLPQ